MTPGELSPELRNLIDERLDAIEQVLLRCGVAYSERRNIVDEVATQIYEMLARRNEAPTHEDVLAVLAALDPPEKYAPEELRSRLAAPAAPEPTLRGRQRGPRISMLAVASLLAAAIALIAGVVCIANDFRFGFPIVLFGWTTLVALVCGPTAIVQIIRSEGRLTGLSMALCATLVLPAVLGNCLLIAAVVVSGGVFAWLITAAVIVYLNVIVLRKVRSRWPSWREWLVKNAPATEAGAARQNGGPAFPAAAGM